MDLKINDNFIFLLCSERSGSNFITKLMNNHSKICGPSTKHIINPVARNYFRYQPLHQSKQWEALVDDILNLFNIEFSVWKSKFTKEELLDSIDYGDLSGLITHFFNKEANANQKDLCFIKEIKAYEFYPFLRCYFKNAKFLYQVRDPRDMALSWKKSKIHRGGIIEAAKQWKTDQQQFIKIVEIEKLTNSIHFITYEDLVSRPEENLDSTLDLLDLNFETDMLDTKKDSLTAKNANSQKAWENLSKPVMKNNFNKFEKELSANEIRYVESICYFEMKYFGYEALFDWDSLKKISTSEIKSYHVQENSHLEYNLTKGVKENMQAKQRFYQHLK